MTAATSRRLCRSIAARISRLAQNTSGLALLEFAFTLPILLTMSLTGAELTNYVTTRMRVSQMALQLADNAARMGKGTQITAKSISELDINDLLTGANLQSGELDLNGRGRVILSDLEPVANPNPTNKYKIVWQRCYGGKTAHASKYGKTGDTGLDGIGPTGQLAVAQPDNATMFVEVYYEYKPLIGLGSLAPSTTMTETASMAVRDRRDLSQIYNNENVAKSLC
ncbi:MAG: pilus assembly protein [Pseudomonadota bacterium]|nr:pilus assembly protein [Pseudomonadota bacterium]